MKAMPMRGQRTATNKANKTKEGMAPKKMGAASKKMPPGLLMAMQMKSKAKK
jgi:hypothetical protein